MTATPTSIEIPVTLIGHPFATVGMGEQLRSHIAACRSVHVPFKVLDIFRYAARSDSDHRKLVEPFEIDVPPGGLRIFHVNGDEIPRVLKAFGGRGGTFADGYNIIVPAWELPKYPEKWAKQLRKFNEVWALSHFIEGSLAAVGISSTHIGQPVEVPLGYFLPRKYFGIRESAFVLLNFLDLSSFSARKNPEAALTMFEALRRRREFRDIQLVIKAKKGDKDAEDWLQPIRGRLPEARFLAKPMSALETRSLINCCDCFVSLHRAEGFGRCTGEAMFLGRLALATSWSGNLDYMTKENSLLVDHNLVPIRVGEYPFAKGQLWAEPNVDHAVDLLEAAMGDPDWARVIAANGRRDVRLAHGFRAVGLRVLDRVTQIAAELARRGVPAAQRDSRARERNARRVRALLPVKVSTPSVLPTERGGVQVWLAAGSTDMRKGFDGLAELVRSQLADDPFSGQLFVFRGRAGDRVKILRWDGAGLCLFAKRLKRGRFVWPKARSGSVALSAAQLSMLLEGIDWRRPVRTHQLRLVA
jgi:transposase